MRAENRIGHIEPIPVRVTPTEEPVFDLQNDRQRQVLERLEQGFEAAATDEGMRAWLRVVSKFHHYSLNNTLLIMVQRPDATQVMGYGDKDGKTGWKSVGRQVRKGEQAIRIFAPQHCVVRETDETTGEEQKHQVLTGFRIVNVFDIRSTDGEPLPEHPGKQAVKALERSDERAAEVNKRLGWWLTEEGLEVSSEPMTGHKMGYYAPHKNKVAVRQVEMVDPLNVQMTKTLAHEAAHYAAGHAADMDRGQAEVVAECAAFVVMDHFGFDTGQYSFVYSAGWANGDKEVFKEAMGDIKKVSGVLIGAIEGSTPEYRSAPAFADEDEFLHSRELQESEGEYRLWSKSNDLYERYATELERERRRMADLEERGVDALSRYDIEIAASGDADRALATAKYLVGNHITYFESKLAKLDAPAKQRELF